jgi:GTP 3',8-cyclase
MWRPAEDTLRGCCGPVMPVVWWDRVRLTADGQIRNCLFATDENDLRTPLRAGADDDQLAATWRRAVAAKLPGHDINDPGFLQPARPMSAIGG